ncbi:MAG TPA: DMT family transporter [Burkholderiales bacterium]|jgi:drug/metabolite transporter (DMT)-like permease
MSQNRTVAEQTAAIETAAAAFDPQAGQRGAYVLLLVTPLLFVTNYLTARVCVPLIPPLTLAFLRWGFTALLAGAVAWPLLRRHAGAAAAEWRDLLLLGAIGMALCGASAYEAAKTTVAVNIGLIYAASPAMIAILARFMFNERMGRRQVAGMGACLAGVLWIVARGDPLSLLQLRFVPGDLWSLAGSIGWAVYSALLKQRRGSLPPSVRFVWLCVAGAVVLVPLSAWELARVPALWSFKAALYVALLVVVASFGAYQAYDRVQRVLGAARTGIIMYLGPVYAAFLAWVLLGEELHPFHAVGAALVLGGVYLVSRRGR